jgi:hypothetical protein
MYSHFAFFKRHIALMKEALSTSETSVNFCDTTLHSIPEGCHLQDLSSFQTTVVMYLSDAGIAYVASMFLFGNSSGLQWHAICARIHSNQSVDSNVLSQEVQIY